MDSSFDINKLSEGKIFDCNRPLLSSLLSKWGCEIIDLGVEKDNYDKLKSKLNYASKKCDVLLTSGGASSGDADFLSQMIKDEGKLFEWRIAIKPGRPLSLGLWNKMPIFGLQETLLPPLFVRSYFFILQCHSWGVQDGENQ